MLLLCAVPGALATTKTSQHFTVVIDAGHGGKDPGAQDNGVTEKDINLGVARKLAEFIRKNLKQVKVVLTRDKDEYLTLQQRADKANKSGGNLFISIHVNSADAANPKRSQAAGVSTHVLGQSKDRKNADVVRRENAVIKLEKNYTERYQGFDPDSDESYIIFEMMQKRFQERSLDLARDIQKNMRELAGRKDRGVTQEPFWVLWSTSMPAVLVELDFICNPNSAKYIASTQGQNKLAKALFNAIRSFYQQEMAIASQPQQMQQTEETVDDGRTYVGDGYAIIGNSASPERKVTGQQHTSARRQNGFRRRSAAARDVSAARTREQKEINVRTHAEPAVMPVRPTRNHQASPAPAQEQPKSRKQKTSKSRKTAKDARANRRRGERTVTASTAGNTSPQPTAPVRQKTGQPKNPKAEKQVKPKQTKQPEAKKNKGDADNGHPKKPRLNRNNR